MKNNLEVIFKLCDEGEMWTDKVLVLQYYITKGLF